MKRSANRRLLPQLVSVLREGYTWSQCKQDLIAGVIVGIVALPLSIAFAIASGVKPEQGLYTAVIAGFLIAALSGSRVQIGGPTGAFIVVIYGIVAEYGYSGLAAATLISGLLLIAMGLLGFGALIKYIPYPVTIGFTAGIALIIFSGQIKDFFGLQIDKLPPDFLEKLEAYAQSYNTFNPWALAVALSSIAIIWYFPRVTKKVPGSLIAILFTTAVVALFDLPVETIESRFGSVPNTLPSPQLPEFSWKVFSQMFSPAITIAMLGAIESLLSAVVADGMTGRRHRSDMELVAQGVANFASPFFQGIPATGAIARTATNIKNGGRTPIAGIVHCATLLVLMVLFGHWAAMIPMATLAAILIVVSYHMSELHVFFRLFRSPMSDVLVMLCTFFLTVLVDLTVAIQVGVALAIFLFTRRMASLTETGYITDQLQAISRKGLKSNGDDKAIAAGIEVFEIQGPFFFGAVEKFKDALSVGTNSPAVLILRMRQVPLIDATGIRAVEDLCLKTDREGTALLLSGVSPELREMLMTSRVLSALPAQSVFETFELALERAEELLQRRAVNQTPAAAPIDPPAQEASPL